MKPQLLTLLIILTGFLVTACASPTEQPVLTQSAPSGGGQSGQSAAVLSPTWNQTVQVDEQGAVVVEVTPLNLNTQADTLEFEIALNTHSVDLGMDLAPLATLSTDAGIAVPATSWDATRGGHHVSGKLIFPSTIDGYSFLDRTTKIILQIRDIDAPMRKFEWQLQ